MHGSHPVCLICEDEMLIGVEVENWIADSGLQVAGPFVSNADAIAWLKANKPDVAVLNYSLRDGECLPLVDVLQDQRVPIVIHSGWRPEVTDLAPQMIHVPWVIKPSDSNTLLKAIADAAPLISLAGLTTEAGLPTAATSRFPVELSGGHVRVFINRLKRLATLSDAAAQAMADAVVRTQMFASAEDIVSAGLPASECHVLLGGLAAPYKLLRDGRRQIVRFAFPGDFVDLDAFIGGKLDHSVTTLGICKVGVIPHQILHDLSAAHPEIAKALWRHTLADTAIFREWVVNVGQRSAQERVAHIICEVFLRLHEAGLAMEISGNKTFSWQMNQQDLADATGMSVVHINRSIQRLRALELIELTRDKVTILDLPGLESLAGFESDYLTVAQQGRAGDRSGSAQSASSM